MIQAWARSRDPTKPQRALRLLKVMKERSKQGDPNVHPNLIAYNAGLHVVCVCVCVIFYKGGEWNLSHHLSLCVCVVAIDACARCMGDTKQQTEAANLLRGNNHRHLKHVVCRDFRCFLCE